MNSELPNILTVDLEDWIQSVYNPDAPLTDHFIHNTYRLLQLLAEHNAKATFFVLGLCAEKAPGLIKEVHSAGHEVQSHGYGHRLIHTQTPESFRDDLMRAKGVLEDIIGERVTGYRAPGFSITRRSLWALDVLMDCGFSLDSSIFPIRMRRYGISGVPARPFQLHSSSGVILEIPVSTIRLCGVRLPAGGGGYIRLWPYAMLRRVVRQANGAGRPAVIYVHPYELNPTELRNLPQRIPFSRRLHQGLGRVAFARRFRALLREFPFTTMRSALRELGDLPSIAAHELRVARRVAPPPLGVPRRAVHTPV